MRTPTKGGIAVPNPDIPAWFGIPAADGPGAFARFRDSEGNRVGLWSRQ